MKDIKSAILMLIMFTVICGGIYPAVVTGVAHAVFPKQAAGSFLRDKDNRAIGSSLIGQPFSDPKYFWPRPAATADFGYNPAVSSGSNAGPTNPAYLDLVAARIKVLRESGMTGPVPGELVQASASGLDPHISPEAAAVQLERVARSRGLAVELVAQRVAQNTEERQFGLLGAPRVNVLALNLALDSGSP